MFVRTVQMAVHRVQAVVDSFIWRSMFPPGGWAPALVPSMQVPLPSAVSFPSFLESLKDGIVWGVPKKRRSLKKRKERWYGPIARFKFAPREDLIVCVHCGNPHEAGVICETCYAKVKAETRKIQEAMKIAERVPRSQDVVVLYEGETIDSNAAGKDIVELPNKRPLWFSPTLLTKVIEGKR